MDDDVIEDKLCLCKYNHIIIMELTKQCTRGIQLCGTLKLMMIMFYR